MEEKSQLDISRAANEVLKERVANFKALSQSLLEARIMDAAAKAGKLKKGAEGDYLERGRGIFKIKEDGSGIEPRDGNGMLIFSPSTSAQNITVEEWAETLKETAPHFWEPERKAGNPVDLEEQLARAYERKDIQSQIRLKRLIHEKRQEV